MVQGQGVRPAIARLAAKCGLAGAVSNTLRGLEIILEGDLDRLRAFRDQLPRWLPPACNARDLRQEDIPPQGRTEFVIVQNRDPESLSAAVPLDTATCPTCRQEEQSADDRRSGYLLIGCAACGPRYTMIRAMPYERAETAMSEFAMCAACAREYRCPADRRFHAQSIACAQCGPGVWAEDRHGALLGANHDAVAAAVSAIRAGQIVALRGLGGYQLLCDATSQAAVQTLRQRKGRPDKPLAVLVASLAIAAQLARLSPHEQTALDSPANPIVLVPTRDTASLARSVHPQLAEVGLLLPTTPVHAALVAGAGRPLICTSGNREGDPLEYQPQPARQHLGGLADVFLHHNREIERPVDDSVVRLLGKRLQVIRLARGFAPLPLDLPCDIPMMALGGQMKSALAWSNGAQAVLGPHMGELESLPARERWGSQYQDFKRLYRCEPKRIVHDAHPEYYSTRYALSLGPDSRGNPPSPAPRLMAVPHHHAHAAAAMLEHRAFDEPVLCATWDGTGLGADGTLWGGEFLLCQGLRQFERVGHFQSFAMAGGDAAAREPWRAACAVLRHVFSPRDLHAHADQLGVERELVQRFAALLGRPALCFSTTSVGRLFDAAACIALGVTHVSYEGQAPLLLEAVADRRERGSYPLPHVGQHAWQFDWRPLFAALWRDRQRGISPGVLAMRFHRTLASAITEMAARFANHAVLLSGGVFQNALLLELIDQALGGHGGPLRWPGVIPVNDGGLAAGQLAIAAMCHEAGCPVDSQHNPSPVSNGRRE